MKIYNTLKILVTLSLVFIPSLFVSAQSLEVQFEREPLFGEANFLPGDTKSGDAKVLNGTEKSQTVYVESVNGFDPDGLGSQMRLVIKDESQVIYNDVFAHFLSSGAVELTELGSGEGTTYTFEVSFIDSSQNDYQGKSLGFDLCLGFYGGNSQCSDTVIGEEGGNENMSNLRSSGGGSSSKLKISDEEANSLDISGDGTAVVTWTTNKLATSRVIYGLMSEGPNYPACLVSGPCYNLDISHSPNYGYPNSSNQSQTKVTEHTVILTGLVPGQAYSYRVVSSASPDTVGYEYGFVIAGRNSNDVPLVSLSQGDTDSTLLDAEKEDRSIQDVKDENREMMLGLALIGFAGEWWVTASLFAIVVVSLWLLFKKRARQD